MGKQLDLKDVATMWIMHTPKGTLEFGYKAGEDPPTPKTKPVWMDNFKKRWDNPSDPVMFEFTLSDETYIQDAINFLHNGPVEGIKYPASEDDE